MYPRGTVGAGETLTLDEPFNQMATQVADGTLGAGRLSGTPPQNPPYDVGSGELARDPLDVAFVNLMPDTAFLDTEEQFLGLTWEAAGQIGVPLRVWRFWIRGVPRGEAVMQHIGRSYLEIETLIGSRVDALIVTGTEPRAKQLDEEAFWPTLAELIQWSADAVPSVILSCLASHAAAKLFGGVERTRLPQKLSGVYRTDPTGDATITEGIVSPLWLPHSRANDIRTSVLEDCGFQPALCAGESWTAMEFEYSKARYLMFQGHPEYGRNSLLREHRRDVRRYFTGERDSYPPVPEGYLDEVGLSLLKEFASQPTTVARDLAGMGGFPTEEVEPHIEPNWRHAAEMIYRNWVRQVVARRTDCARSVQLPAPGIQVYAGAGINA
ncbi:MAG: homoserine O-acetyltransferase/O-succinyltransferase family protein [Candidatus Dormibacteria bacterium]